jgi:hypothetical protein
VPLDAPDQALLRRASGVEPQHRLHHDAREPTEQACVLGQAAPLREGGLQQRAVLRLLLAARAVVNLGVGAVSGDLARCREATAPLRLALFERSST